MRHTYAYETTIIIDDAMLADAMRLTGLTEKTAVVHARASGIDQTRDRKEVDCPRRIRSEGSGAAAQAPAAFPPAMILPDSSVWIEHFRHGNASLAAWLENDETLCHPFIVGELACGHLSSGLDHPNASNSARGTPDAARGSAAAASSAIGLKRQGLAGSMRICWICVAGERQKSGRSTGRGTCGEQAGSAARPRTSGEQ